MIILFLLVIITKTVFSAVGCTLNDPDRDVKRLFPEATGYLTEFITIEERGGSSLEIQVEKLLDDRLNGEFENMDVPYAYYTVRSGEKIIGRIHGVNQRGKYGSMQIILATDLNGKIWEFYLQKITSPDASRFRNKNFTELFTGIELKDFLEEKSGRIYRIITPSERSESDFRSLLRGIRKNLILLQFFKLQGEK